MFWRMTGLSAASPVDTILDKENFTLEELLDEDEIIQECKALNTRLINFLRDKAQVEQLLRYVVEEVPEDAEKKRSFKFPFIACEIFTCEIDVILRTLVEHEELMELLFSFVKPDHPHSTLLSGYFSKVVICLMLRKTAPLMNYVQGHPELVVQLVDLIGITSIMEVLIRLIGADETIYSNYADTLQWLENTDVLEMIADKFSSSFARSFPIQRVNESRLKHLDTLKVLRSSDNHDGRFHIKRIISPASGNSYFTERGVGKPGFISFQGSCPQTRSVESVPHPGKEGSRLVWFVGRPTILVAFLVLPSLYLRKVLSAVFEDSLLTGFCCAKHGTR